MKTKPFLDFRHVFLLNSLLSFITIISRIRHSPADVNAFHYSSENKNSKLGLIMFLAKRLNRREKIVPVAGLVPTFSRRIVLL